MQEQKNWAETVSYTHLDVYKRQPIDCAEVDLRNSWIKLGEITGESTTPESVLDKIFSEFCIGK